MRPVTLSQSNDPKVKSAIAELLAEAPILAQVRFRRAASSPDWCLLEDKDDFDELLQRLEQGVEVHLGSVWDFKKTKNALSFVL